MLDLFLNSYTCVFIRVYIKIFYRHQVTQIILCYYKFLDYKSPLNSSLSN